MDEASPEVNVRSAVPWAAAEIGLLFVVAILFPSVVFGVLDVAGFNRWFYGGDELKEAVKAGGRGDVTKTHVLWRKNKGSNVASPIYHDGHLYWAGESNEILYCQSAATGEFVYQERLKPASGRLWASPVLADGKSYYLSQRNGTYVVPAQPKFALLAHNVFEDDKSRANASIAVNDGQILLRTDRYLYCIGTR